MEWFTFQADVLPFRLFSPAHGVAIMSILFVNILIYGFRKPLRAKRINRIVRYFLGSALIIQELSLNIWRLMTGKWSVETSLPLHLCGFAVVLCAYMAFTGSERIYEIVYFWGIGGATQALITPDIGLYGFPHYRFYQFFVSHGLIIITICFMTFVHQYRPYFSSLKKSFIIINILMIFVGGVNIVTGGNYFFIAHKPDTASLIDFLGPWPYYILSLEVLCALIFSLCYLPFKLTDQRKPLNYKQMI